MIHRSSTAVEPESWQSELRHAIGSVDELLDFIGLSNQDLKDIACTETSFPIRVPRSYARRMEHGNPRDPLLLQVLPTRYEHTQAPFFSTDPLEEASATPAPGLIHKYANRALLILTGACAINCRYCFRRHFPYQEHSINRERLARALDYISDNPDINEVILSGGDPLLIRDEKLSEVLEAVAGIPHVRRIRLHTRTPVVIPQRITPALIRTLESSRLDAVMVLHVNHPNELDASLVSGLKQLAAAGVTLLNQSVLLKNVNDHPDTLCKLSERLFDYGILPYYLHLLDPVQGAAHFDLPLETARILAGQIAARLPGYLVPRLVREEAGKPAKTVIAPLLEPAS